MATKPAACIYEFGSFHLDPRKRLLLRGGEVIALTPKCMDILLVLVESAGERLSKDELMRRVWPDSFVEESNLTFNISTLRKALGEKAADHHFIITIPRHGYLFAGEVRNVEEILPDDPASVPPGVHRKAKKKVLLIAGGLVLLSVALIWWLGMRGGKIFLLP